MKNETTAADLTGTTTTPATDDLAGKPKGKKPAAKKAAAKKPAAAAKKAVVKKQGTDAFLRERIIAGDTNEMALKACLKKFPKASTSMACASWNRSQLKNHREKFGVAKSVKILTNAEATAKHEK